MKIKTLTAIVGLSVLIPIYQYLSGISYQKGFNEGWEASKKWRNETTKSVECYSSGFVTAKYDIKEGCLIDRMEADCRSVSGMFINITHEKYKECLKNLTVSDFVNKRLIIAPYIGKEGNDFKGFSQGEWQWKISEIDCNGEKCTYKKAGVK